jgi:chorismate--pyruvate lyase
MSGMRRRSGPPDWRDATPRSMRAAPRQVRPWIGLASSMTRRIEAATGHGVRVKVVRDAAGRLNPDEQEFFSGARSGARVREVVLSADGAALLAARTAFVARRLKLNRNLRALGARPLGDLLFGRGGARWIKREFARLHPRPHLSRPLASALPARCGPVWARRTLFILKGSRILVTEIFLPSLLPAL